MPYCPKCDMEFVDGITVCSDCGGPLAASEEVAKAMKIEEAKEAAYREQLAMQAQTAQLKDDDLDPDLTEEELQETLAKELPEDTLREKPRVYVSKAEKYEDLKSSASAFLIIGGFLLIASILLWSGIISLPMPQVTKLIFQSALTVLGILAVVVYGTSTKSAKELAPQIAQENQLTTELIDWFVTSYDQPAVDTAIQDIEELSPEELILKRFQVIQDYLITHHDLPDPSYVDSLCEKIYTKLFEEL